MSTLKRELIQSRLATYFGMILAEANVYNKKYLLISNNEILVNLHIIWDQNDPNLNSDLADFWCDLGFGDCQTLAKRSLDPTLSSYRHFTRLIPNQIRRSAIDSVETDVLYNKYSELVLYKIGDYLHIKTLQGILICQNDCQSELFWRCYDEPF